MRTDRSDAQLPRNEEMLGDYLRRKLGQVELDEELWLYLNRGAFVSGALYPPSSTGLLACRNAAQKYLQAHPSARHAMPRAPRSRAVRIPPREFKKPDLARAELYSKRILELARQNRAVITLREQLWPGRPFTPEEACRMLTSPLNALASHAELQSLGVPVTAPDVRFCKSDGSDAVSWDEDVIFRVRWPGGTRDVPYRREWFFRSDRLQKALTFPCREGQIHTVQVGPGSLLDSIREVAGQLVRFLPWEEHEAIGLILCDTAPLLGPVRVQVHGSYGAQFHDGRITLTVEPWVSPRTVMDVFARVQRTEFGARTRAATPMALQLYEFVAPRLDDRDPHWREHMEAWNRLRSRRRYSDYRKFRSDFIRIQKWVHEHVLYPRYKLMERPDAAEQSSQSPSTSKAGKVRARTRSSDRHKQARRPLRSKVKRT